MNSLTKIVTGIGCLLGSYTAVAATCDTGGCREQIQSITVSDTGVFVRLIGDLPGISNCTPEQSHYMTILKTNPNYAAHYAALLAAYHAKDTVYLRPQDGSVGCHISYIAIP